MKSGTEEEGAGEKIMENVFNKPGRGEREALVRHNHYRPNCPLGRGHATEVKNHGKKCERDNRCQERGTRCVGPIDKSHENRFKPPTDLPHGKFFPDSGRRST